MFTDTTLQRTLAAANSLGEPTYLINLASLVLYLDIVLSIAFQASLTGVTFDWARTHVTVGGAIIFLLSYVFIKSTLLPQIQSLFYLLVGMRIDIWYNERVSRAGRRISEAEWLEYSILTRNTPAYRELEARRKDMDDAKEFSKSSFCLAAFMAGDISLGLTMGESIAGSLFKFIDRLPRVASWVCIGSLGIFTMMILLGGLLIPCFTDIWMPVRKRALKAEIRRVLTDEPEE